jgi:hypothetical protein
MSSVSFHTRNHETKLSGAERAWMDIFVQDLAEKLLGVRPGDSFACDYAEVLRPVIVGRLAETMPPPHDREASGPERTRNWDLWEKWSRSFVLHAMGSMSGTIFKWRELDLDSFELQLNSAMRVGGDVVKLMARLHGACEIHTWVAEKNRAWLADIIELGLEDGLLRTDARGYDGWNGIVTHCVTLRHIQARW